MLRHLGNQNNPLAKLETEDEEPRTEAGAGEGEMESEEKHFKMQELVPRTEPKTRLTALYSYSALHPDDLSFEKG